MTPPAEPSAEKIPSIAAGIAVTGLGQALKVIISFVSAIVLAHFLRPQDFGLMAMLAPSIALIGLFQDLGLHHTIIQRETLSHGQKSGLFWISLAASALLATILALSASFQVEFYSEPRLFNLTVASSFLVVIWNIQSINTALLTRSMQFRRLVVIDLTATIAGFCIGAAIAYETGSYWAIYAGMLAAGLTATAMSWSASGFRPRAPAFEGEVANMLAFGSSVSVFQFLNFISRNADLLMIGRFHGASELGLYERAYKLLLFPLQQVTFPVGRVMIPFLSRTRNEPGRYRHGFVKCITGIMILTQPAILFAVIYSDDLLRALLGPKWLAAAPIFFWLGLAGLHQVATSTLGWLLISQTRNRDLLITGAVGCLISVAAFVVGLPDGALGVARAYAIADIVIKMPFVWWVISRSGPVRLPDLLTAAWPHCLAIATAGSGLVLARGLIEGSSLTGLIALILSSYLIYVGTLMCIGSKSKVIVAEVSKRLKRRPDPTPV